MGSGHTCPGLGVALPALKERVLRACGCVRGGTGRGCTQIPGKAGREQWREKEKGLLPGPRDEGRQCASERMCVRVFACVLPCSNRHQGPGRGGIGGWSAPSLGLGVTVGTMFALGPFTALGDQSPTCLPAVLWSV